MNKVTLMSSYNYKGSINCSLTLMEREDGDVDLLTSYGERIKTIQSDSDLMRVLKDLEENKYS